MPGTDTITEPRSPSYTTPGTHPIVIRKTMIGTDASGHPSSYGHPGSAQMRSGHSSPNYARPYDLAMFMVALTSLVDLSEVDAVLPEHVAWLDQQYADGVFVASGRQVPRVG